MRAVVNKFFADRGTHLAAMIAYFALLSFVPLVFLALALLGLFNRADASSYLVTELQTLFPSQSIVDIVRVVNAIQRNAATLGIVGGRRLPSGVSGTSFDTSMSPESPVSRSNSRALRASASEPVAPSRSLMLNRTESTLRAPSIDGPVGSIVPGFENNWSGSGGRIGGESTAASPTPV